MIRILFIFLFLFLGCFTIAQTNKSSVTYQTYSNVSYRSGDGLDNYQKERCKLDIYVPENQNGFTTVVWFHGGGLTAGEKAIPERLKNQGLGVVAVNYRLSPKVKSPAYIDDAAAAVAWVIKNIPRYGGDPQKVVVSGHSAGGYLTCMIGLDKHYLAAYGIDANTLQKLVPFSGQMITHFEIRREYNLPPNLRILNKI